jgi:hypothetical protein
MLALWFMLAQPAAAVETVPTAEITAYLEKLRGELGTEGFAIGYSGYDNEDRLKPHFEGIPFVTARRIATQGDPEKLMKGLMKKASATCGFIATGGGRNIALSAVGTCTPEQTEEQAWAESCRAEGVATRFPDGDTSRFEALRPSLPDGVDQATWDAATGAFTAALASCSLASGDLPEEARMTIKLSWAADGTPMWGKTTPGGAPDHIGACAEKIASCLGALPEGDQIRSVNQVVRILPAAETPDEEGVESEEAEATP